MMLCLYTAYAMLAPKVNSFLLVQLTLCKNGSDDDIPF